MGTLQWHHVHSPKVGTLQWHPAMAPRPLPQSWSSNGTLRWHPAMAPRPLPRSWSSPSPPTIAHYNGTLRWHHVHSPKVGRRPPLLEVRIPIAIAIWGKTGDPTSKKLSSANAAVLVRVLKYIGHPFPFSSNMENWLSN